VDGGGGAVFFLQAGWNHFQRNVSLGMRGKGVLLLEGHELGSDADPPSAPAVKTRRPVDPSQWNLFELQFRADRVRAFVGGEEVGTIPRSAAYREGHVALQVLASTVAFRRIEVVRR
jgi:hypothetical protein